MSATMNNKYNYPYPVSSDSERALVIFSGGQDSTTCLLWAIDNFEEVFALTINYGQKHAIEVEAAQMIASLHNVKHRVIDVGPILQGTSPLVNQNEKLEEYANPESLPGGLEKTFVPMRNQMFITLAANYAYVMGIRNLVTGICQADSGGYPDCREDFKNTIQLACNLGTFTGEPGTVAPLKIHAPLMHLSKAQSIELAIDVGAYTDLMWSHTAYNGAYPPESHDHANLLRIKGFTEAGLPDPLVVRAWAEGLMELPDTENYKRVGELWDCRGENNRTIADLVSVLDQIASEHVRERNL